MNRRSLCCKLSAMLVLGVWSGVANGVDRIGTSQKGSLLIFPKIELRWKVYLSPFGGPPSGAALAQDVYLSLSNDFPDDVRVHMFFLNGDPPTSIDPGWNHIDCVFILTKNQPTFVSMANGGSGVCVPFTVLDPGSLPGRPDPDAFLFRHLRGTAYLWAEAFDSSLQKFRPIRWNHLSGEASIVDFRNASVTKYSAYAAQVVDSADGPQHGEFVGEPGMLNLDGQDYEFAFDMLTFNFYSEDSKPYQTSSRLAQITNDLTFHPVSVDYRQDGSGPVCTKLNFRIWNQDEVQFENTERCICCWDQTLMKNYAQPNFFLLGNLLTTIGRARVDGVASDLCPLAQHAAILGLLIERQQFRYTSEGEPVIPSGTSFAALPMIGQGLEEARILYDPPEPTGE